MRTQRLATPVLCLAAVQVAFVAACLLLYASEDCADTPTRLARCGSSSGENSARAAGWPPRGTILGRDELQGSARQTLFVITPTFARLAQKLDLTRLSHTLFVAGTRHRIHWIVVEDARERSALVAGVLARSGLVYTHLNKKEQHIAHHFKGGEPRNEGIRFLRRLSPPPHPDSVVYFADDDNAYDAALFDEIARVQTIGVLPVGYSGGRRAEFPVVRAGRVVSFEAYMSHARKFAVDMAGFAMHVSYFLRPTPLLFEVNAPKTTGETRLLEAAGAELAMLQPLANNCTRVLVWHVRSFIAAADFEPAPDEHIGEV